MKLHSESRWQGLPYYPISQFYRKKFGGKVYKLSVSVVDDCPNRQGLKGMETCLFCDIWGSAAYPENRHHPLVQQIQEAKQRVLSRQGKNATGFLVYFQAYTNTFTKLKTLRANFDLALQVEGVKGLVVGTRPDCISPSVLKMWREYTEQTFVSVELGVQSFNNRDLTFLRRGHDAQCSVDAINKIKSETDVDLGVHLMFGMPEESDDDVIATAQKLNDLPVDNVKLHNLHVLENTPLAQMFRAGDFVPMGKEEYGQRVQLFLQHLSPHIAVHRLGAASSRWDELVAPQWTKFKMNTYQFILDQMQHSQSFQGQLTNQ